MRILQRATRSASQRTTEDKLSFGRNNRTNPDETHISSQVQDLRHEGQCVASSDEICSSNTLLPVLSLVGERNAAKRVSYRKHRIECSNLPEFIEKWHLNPHYSLVVKEPQRYLSGNGRMSLDENQETKKRVKLPLLKSSDHSINFVKRNASSNYINNWASKSKKPAQCTIGEGDILKPRFQLIFKPWCD